MDSLFNKKSFWGGLLFIAAGLLLLLQNFNLLPFAIPTYIFSWKMLLIVLAFFMALSHNWTSALILFCIGFYFLIPDFFGIHTITLAQLWPAVLIIIGILIVSNLRKKDKKKIPINLGKYNEGFIDTTILFGGDSKKISSYDFKGGQISIICGGLELDLTNCTLSKEETLITVNVLFGGLEITVPREWNVRSEVIPIMGGIDDELHSKKDHYIDPAAELIIRGNVIMGGLEIKRS